MNYDTVFPKVFGENGKLFTDKPFINLFSRLTYPTDPMSANQQAQIISGEFSLKEKIANLSDYEIIEVSSAHFRKCIDDRERRSEKAMYAGLAAQRLIQLNKQIDKPSVAKANAEIGLRLEEASLVNSKGAGKGTGKRAVEKALNEYRAVVHFWAAWLMLTPLEKSSILHAPNNKLGYDNLAKYLCVAAWFEKRLFGDTDGSSLKKVDRWHFTVPDVFNLDQFDIPIETMSKAAVTFYAEYSSYDYIY